MAIDRTEHIRFEEQQAERLDKFLATQLPDFSRSRLQALIKEGRVLVNGVPAHKTGQILDHPADIELQVPQAEPSDLVPEDIPLQIVFENENLLVIDKPAGMVVHPAAGHTSGTLVHAALGYAPDIDGVGGEKRPGVVHRLDKDTSGLILLAKNDVAHRWLQDQFRLRKVEKTYLALVDGFPPTPSGRIEASVGRDTSHRKQMAVVPPGKGRPATSEYRTLEKFAQHSLLEVKPETGRTHQIRLHLAYIGCPVVGDRVYGHRKPSLPLKRHFLHAWRLKIRLPGETQPHVFEAPLPDELVSVLEQLRNEAIQAR
jgi:23S rRNA pseudouridine1911/1915/1917 synthase